MKYFFRSVVFFIPLIFRKRRVDVIFYYPQHFNRGKDSTNIFFDPLYKACKKNKLNYLIFEEPGFSSKPRNDHAIPFDFVYLIIIFLRRLKISDESIGKILSNTILRGLIFKNYIVLSQSMLSIFRYMSQNAKLFDLQHGILYKEKSSYIIDGKPSSSLRRNRVNLLLFGDRFKSILLQNDSCNYFVNFSHVIGISKADSFILHSHINNNILVTLQFTHDHTDVENDLIAHELEEFIKRNQKYNFFLRSHPRYNNEINLSRFFRFNNVEESDLILEDCFRRCSLHLTAYSTTTFESAYFGIPTIFLTSLSNKFNMFNTEFNYPLRDNRLQSIEEDYNKSSTEVKNWSEDFYTSFDEKKFISLIK